MAEVGAEGSRVLNRGDAVWVDRRVGGGLGGKGDAQTPRIGADFLEEGSLGGWRPVGIAGVRAGCGVEEGGAVAN